MVRRLRTLSILLGLALVLSAARAAETIVRVGEYYFDPPIVTIAIGDIVTWVNEGFQPHDTTSAQGVWASPSLFSEESYSFTFTSSGQYPYICARHIADYPGQTGLVLVASANLPPSVGITNPASGSAFLSPASFSLNGSASDSDGVVTNVQFFVDGNSVGNSTGPVFSASVIGLGAGNYLLTAVATDNQGATATSDAVSISVTNPPAKYPLTISMLPSNRGTVTVAPPQPPEGYDAGTEVTLTASAANGFAFNGWSGSVVTNQNPLLLTMDSAKAITANFISNTIPTHTLTLAVNPLNSGTIQAQPAPNGPDGTYLDGTIVMLTATPTLNFAFTNWTGDVISASNSIVLTIDSDKSVTANFFASITPLFVLTVVTNPSGAGTIQITPLPNATNGTYIQGTVVTLTATAVGTNSFTNWTGAASSISNRITLLMDADKSVTANFVAIIPPTYTLTIAIGPTNGGTVLVTPAAGAGGTYSAGTTVALAAQPGAGFRFANWTGAVNSTNNPIVIVMNGNRSVTAVFAPLTPVEFPALSGVYAGLLIDDGGANYALLNYAASGPISLRLSKTGAYRGTATIGGRREFVAGQFDRFGYAPFVARRATLSGSLQIDGAGLRMHGSITDGRKSPQLVLYRAVTATNIAALASNYLLTVDTGGPVNMEGAVTLRVLVNGSARMHGTLGDGTAFNERTFLSADATIPWFVPLYGHRGAILSWLDVRDDGTVQGTARWFRPGDSRSVNYPTGFGLIVPVAGSRAE